MRNVATLLLLFVTATPLCLRPAVAPTAPATTTTEATTEATTEPAAKTDEKKWEFSLSAYTYIVPNDREYVQPTLRVDRDWLHLEARYNYEDIDTGSVFVGYNMSFGHDLTLDLTPMIG